MKFERYTSIETFSSDTLEILLEDEVQNNLMVSFICDKAKDTSNWLLASIKDAKGSVILTAACTPPFNITLYETNNKPNDTALKLLSEELKSIGYTFPGVLAERGLAFRFAQAHAGSGYFRRHMSMNIMRLYKVTSTTKAPGHCRPLREDDLFFAPYWDRAFAVDCLHVENYDIYSTIERLKSIIGKDIHYIWEDVHPVSQAVHARNTKNGAVINGVYTPPQYRGKGYASSVVAELTQILLERGKEFCCLFADADNPVSCGIYRKIGYYDLCVFNDIKFRG